MSSSRLSSASDDWACAEGIEASTPRSASPHARVITLFMAPRCRHAPAGSRSLISFCQGQQRRADPQPDPLRLVVLDAETQAPVLEEELHDASRPGESFDIADGEDR